MMLGVVVIFLFLYVFLSLALLIVRANIGISRTYKGVDDCPPESFSAFVLSGLAWWLPSFWRPYASPMSWKN